MPEKILIVDDETATRAALEMLLHREGFEVRDASSGEAALAECAAFWAAYIPAVAAGILAFIGGCLLLKRIR